MKHLTSGQQRKIEEVVRKTREESTPGRVARVEIGRKLLTERHCEKGMIQTMVFYKNQEDPKGNPIRGTDEHVCPQCYHHVRGPSDFDGLE